MNEFQFNEFKILKRHLLAFAVGIVGGSLPNEKSNIHPLIVGGLLSGFVVKMIYGDYDENYQWTISDILFWFITILEGVLGALLITYI